MSKPKEYKIGLSINLSGTGGLSGEYIRDGAMLAVEEINKSGGVNKIPIRLLFEDDKGTQDGAIEADKRLIDNGVIAIIGHSHSDTTLASYPYVMSKNMILITAYTATNKLSNKDDLFFRTSVDTVAYGKAMVNLVKNKDIKSLAFVIDNSNKAFGEEFYEETKKGKDIKDKFFKIQSQDVSELDNIVSEIIRFNPESICFLTEVTRTGILVQKLRQRGYKGSFIATLWAQTNDLIKIGGKAVEDINIISFVDPNLETEQYKKFVSNLTKRFPKSSPQRAMRSYEIVYILADVLRQIKDVNSEEIKKALLSKKFDVLSGELSFNKFGDVNRPIYNITVKDGKFLKKEKLL
ncbi:MAG: ABC transporter substrate-binding protein [Thermodesulfovibrionales bacterium]|nr:ABC transporter substrate-binding protein [Thermodesulfovibrionales bacterium]